MTQIALISIVGSATILLLVISLLLVVIWRGKRQSHHEFELLLDDIKDRQAARAESLADRIMQKYPLDQAGAQTLSSQLIGAEKLFLHHFIEQQIQQKSVANSYQQLCELLDSYFDVITGQGDAKDPEALNEAEPARDANVDAGEAETPGAEPEPDWGDVFD